MVVFILPPSDEVAPVGEAGQPEFVLFDFHKGIVKVVGLLVRGRSLLIRPVYPAVQEVGEPLYGLLAVGRALISAVAPIFAWRSACTSAWF